MELSMNKWNKSIAALLCALMLTLCLGACAPAAPENPDAAVSASAEPAQTTAAPVQTTAASAQTPDAAQTQAPAQASTVYPLTVSDSLGTQLTFDAAPQSIVSVSPNMTEILFALGVGDRVIGRTDYCNYPQEAQQAASVGDLFNIDVEKILTLEPDLVIGGTLFQEDTAKRMTDLGITVAAFTDGVTVQDVYAMIETVGQITDAQEAAEACVAQMQARIDAVTAAVAGKEAPTVYYATGFGEYGDYTAGGDTFIHQLITLAGGDNIAKDVSGWVITNEAIFEADPQIILVGTGMKELFMADPLYAGLTAVAQGSVYEINDDIIGRQGPRIADAVEELAKIFHPETAQ